MSHNYRHFIVGGEVDGKPVVVAMQGTYGRHTLHAYGARLKKLWEATTDPKKAGGALGSHMTPVVDIDGDGTDELFVGERCLSLRDGKELFYRQSTKLMAVPFRLTETSVESGKPQALFEVPVATRFQVSRDGQRFLVALPAEGTAVSTQLIVDTNWRAGLPK